MTVIQHLYVFHTTQAHVEICVLLLCVKYAGQRGLGDFPRGEVTFSCAPQVQRDRLLQGIEHQHINMMYIFVV